MVDTIALNGFITGLDASLEGGLHKILLATPRLHVVERISKSADGSTLTDESVWSDPSVRAEPFSMTTRFSFVADPLGYDDECENVGDMFGARYGTARGD